MPLAELIGGDEPAGRTVWAVDAGLGLAAAGDQAGGLFLWRLHRTGAAPATPAAESPHWIRPRC
ncbi:hypothetical protein [Actinomadura alba]|uniref:Uncharacterized protein n=1 Tax=Actinomadura alba TaxID=406431 RepID=A0ABR7LVU4_9ACTN|nr:hypothetical protein [Actinomadura alba]MBC6468870.1 hypothetical protein [Actinomadura alba]